MLLGIRSVSAEGENESKNVISIGNKQYTSIETAVEDAKSGDTLTLLENIDLTKNADYVANLPDNVVFDMQGHKISINNMGLIFTGNGLTIKNGFFETEGSYSLWIGDEEDTNGAVIENVSTVGGLNIYNATDVILRNVNSIGHTYYAVWGDQGSQIVIESGTYKTDGNNGLLGMTPNNPLEKAFVIKGGNFITNDKKLVYNASYEPIIFGGKFNCDITQYKSEGLSVVENADGEYTLGYKINIADNNDNEGIIDVTNHVVPVGEKVEITIQEKEGYKLKSISVVDSKGNSINVSSNKKFTMPESDVTITAIFEEIPKEVTVPEIDNEKPDKDVETSISDEEEEEEKVQKDEKNDTENTVTDNSTTNNPATGDNIIIYIITLLASSVGIFGIIVVRNKHISAKH